MKVTTAQVIARIKRHKPVTAEDVLLDCGLTLRYLNGGSFRNTYHIVGTSLVLKMPQLVDHASCADNIAHAREEYAQYRRILRSRKRFKPLHRYMPRIYFFQPTTGILLMEKYTTFHYTKHQEKVAEIDCAAMKLMGTSETDIHGNNVGIDARGKFKIIDLGLISGRCSW